MTLFDFFEKKNLPAANSTSIESVEEPDMFSLLRGVKFSIFCIFLISCFCDFVVSIFIKVAYYLKKIVKKWFQGHLMSIGVKFCHVLRSMDESSNSFIIQVMFMVSAYPSSERFVLDDLIPVFLFLVFQN